MRKLSALTLSILFLSISLVSFGQKPIIKPGIKPNINENLTVKLGCPDLIVSQLKLVKATANSVEYKYVIKNIGKVGAKLEGPTRAQHDNIKVQAFLSKDARYSKDDLPAGGTIIARTPADILQPNQTKVGSFKANVTKSPRLYRFLILIVDWGKTLKECNERNNFKAVPMRRTAPKCPDFIVQNLRVVSKTDNSIKYQYTIKNIGTQRAPLKGVVVQAYLSGNRTYEAHDVPAGGRVLSTNPTDVLRPGQTITQTFQANTTENPNQYPALLLIVDKSKKVRECRENNNLGVARIR